LTAHTAPRHVRSADAYYKWLGIPPEEQPPNHYRLLGVRAFEADLDVIANAADQRMSHLRTFQSGKYGARSQTMLNEISAAKLCLLKAERKVDYDQKLRVILARSPVLAAPAGSPPPVGPPVGFRPDSAAPPGPPPSVPVGPPPVRTGPAPQRPMPPGGYVNQPPGGYVNQPRVAMPVAAAPAPPDALAQIAEDSSRRRKSRPAKRTSLALPIAAALLFCAAAVVGLLFYQQRQQAGATKEVASEPRPHETALPAPVDDGEKSDAPSAANQDIPSESPATASGSGKPAETKTDTPPATSTDSRPPAQALLEHLDQVVTAQNLERMAPLGGPAGEAFSDAPKGTLLVGIDARLVASGTSSRNVINGMQAIFFNGSKLLVRSPRGAREGTELKVRAKNGYAVGAMDLVVSEEQVLALRLEFRRIGPEHLLLTDSYQSEWIGDPGKIKPARIDGGGRPIIGLYGAASSVLDRLGAILPPLSESEDPSSGSVKAGATAKPRAMLPVSPDFAAAPANMGGAGNRSQKFELRAAVPDAAAQATAVAEIHELYKAQFDALRKEPKAAPGRPPAAPDKRLSLATELLRQASETNDNPLMRFVLFDEARKLFAQAGDPQNVTKIITLLAETYAIDDLQMSLDSLLEAEKANSAPAFKAKLAENALPQIDRAVRAERFDVAESLEALSRKAAKAGQDPLLSRRIDWRKARLAEEQKAHEAATAAQQILDKDADDKAANETVGRYHCFVLRDWEAGLPLLAKGADENLAAVAAQEIAPHDAPIEQVKLAEAWLQAAKADEAAAPECKSRARQWFELALANLNGVTKMTTEKRLEELHGGHGLTAEYFAGAGVFDTAAKTGVDSQLDLSWASPPAGLTGKQFSARWTGWLAAPPKGGQVEITLEHDGGARLWLDQKLVVDGWDGAGRQSTTTTFSPAKPRRLKIEYKSRGATPRIKLLWGQREGFSEQVVPEEALFQDHVQGEKIFSALPVAPAEKLLPLHDQALDDPAKPAALMQ
jgi:hypothetical protein